MTEMLVLIIVVLTAMACSVVGNFLVLRRMALVGDAMSHSMLPGILIAFFIAGTLDSPLFLFFAALLAVIMSLMVDFLIEKVGIFQESAIGVVFTFLFALGVVMLVQFAGDVHIDTHAVLYGNAEFAAFEKLVIDGKSFGPRAIWIMSGVLILNLIFTAVFYKEWKVSIFDQAFSRSVGISPKILHYILIALTSLTVVSAFEIVGVVLVVALLVVPGATAHLVSGKLWHMIGFSLLFALLAGLGGHYLALELDLSLAGSVAVVAGLLLALVLCLQHFLRLFVRRT